MVFNSDLVPLLKRAGGQGLYKLRLIMKKEYMKPSMAVEELLVEGVLALSGTDLGEEGVPFTNKRQPQTGGWSQENWKTEE